MSDYTQLLSDVFDRRAEQRLSLEDERIALIEAQLGSEPAKCKLILAYAPALRNGVTWFTRALDKAPTAHDLEDVRSQAVTGLLEAIAAFDPEKHERLAALAPGYIRDAVSTAASSVTAFTVPERTLKRFFGILRAADGNVFEATKLAPEYQMKPETFLAVLDAVRNVSSYEKATSDWGPEQANGQGTNGGSQDIEASPIWETPVPDLEDRLLVEAALDAINTLERDVCRLAYGFVEYEPVPDAEIAARLGFSRSAVQRTRAAALDKMRVALGLVA